MAKTGEVRINKVTGDVVIELTGYHGKGCSVDMAAFTKGMTVTKNTKKPEWREIQAQQKSVTATA